jgi:hypothetical protein
MRNDRTPAQLAAHYRELDERTARAIEAGQLVPGIESRAPHAEAKGRFHRHRTSAEDTAHEIERIERNTHPAPQEARP